MLGVTAQALSHAHRTTITRSYKEEDQTNSWSYDPRHRTQPQPGVTLNLWQPGWISGGLRWCEVQPLDKSTLIFTFVFLSSFVIYAGSCRSCWILHPNLAATRSYDRLNFSLPLINASTLLCHHHAETRTPWNAIAEENLYDQREHMASTTPISTNLDGTKHEVVAAAQPCLASVKRQPAVRASDDLHPSHIQLRLSGRRLTTANCLTCKSLRTSDWTTYVLQSPETANTSIHGETPTLGRLGHITLEPWRTLTSHLNHIWTLTFWTPRSRGGDSISAMLNLGVSVMHPWGTPQHKKTNCGLAEL